MIVYLAVLKTCVGSKTKSHMFNVTKDVLNFLNVSFHPIQSLAGLRDDCGDAEQLIHFSD